MQFDSGPVIGLSRSFSGVVQAQPTPLPLPFYLRSEPATSGMEINAAILDLSIDDMSVSAIAVTIGNSQILKTVIRVSTVPMIHEVQRPISRHHSPNDAMRPKQAGEIFQSDQYLDSPRRFMDSPGGLAGVARIELQICPLLP